ncbi:DNA-binding CsgD family transcriptional regulator [Constrictibacter sp. MBR-5]|jgi:DNA-binding CsgD family transcriptional regulator|uniref:terminase small subunit n=1 Tax=Constrictibacter sp. MBR-5 TaxID=3156467 RepID=UPI003397F679
MPFGVKTTPLTDRQEIFCRHVARGASGAAAARSAGYSPHSAARYAGDLLTKPQIRHRIEDLRVRREAARQTGIAEIVDRLRALATLAAEKSDLRTAVRCLETEARLCGLYPDRLAAGFAGADPLLDGIDPRHPDLAAADAEAWAAAWRQGINVPEPEPEPRTVPHVYEGFEPRPVDEFTPFTDFHPTPRKRYEPLSDVPPEILEEEMPEEEPLDEDVPPEVLADDGEDDGEDEAAAAGLGFIAGRADRQREIGDAEMEHLYRQAPPVAVNPAAPAWARHPDPLLRGLEAERHGWDPAWERP